MGFQLLRRALTRRRPGRSVDVAMSSPSHAIRSGPAMPSLVQVLHSGTSVFDADRAQLMAGTMLGAPAVRMLSPVGGGLKRFVDVTGAACGLLVLSPMLLMIAAMVRWGPHGGPVLFGHTRIGLNGRPFRCWKFRTMATDGDALLAFHLAADPAARWEWENTRKLRSDPRVTPLGAVMRRLSIDELPQLFNVLRGDMSLVGPRPVVEDELNRYGRFADRYLRSRPGLTGLWQVSGRSDTSYRKRVACDRMYVERWSLGSDFAILVRTVGVVCSARGSY